MLSDYGWSRRMLGLHRRCIGDLARELGVGRHAARERLLASGLPAKLCRFRWTHRGRCYRRWVWAIPPATFEAIVWADLLRRLGPAGVAAVEADGLGPLVPPGVPVGGRSVRPAAKARGGRAALVRGGGAVHKSSRRRQGPDG